MKFVIIIILIYLLIRGVLVFIGNKNISKSNESKVDRSRYYYDKDKYFSNRISLIEQSNDFWDIRTSLVFNAKKSLEISYYVIDPGVTSNIFWGLIIKAADSGVKVRMIVYGMFNSTSHKSIHHALELHPNIELEF